MAKLRGARPEQHSSARTVRFLCGSPAFALWHSTTCRHKPVDPGLESNRRICFGVVDLVPLASSVAADGGESSRRWALGAQRISCVGSRRAARRNESGRATTVTIASTPARMAGCEVSRWSSGSRRRESGRPAQEAPRAIPGATSTQARPRISERIQRGAAPTAIRTPISRVR
jgi:hypothetical protein